MSIFQNIWSDLVEKKLWPVALLLVALIVAVPMMLSKPSNSTEAAVPAPPTVESTDGPQLALTRAATTGFARPPRVNDDRLDPFASRASSAQLKKVEAAISKAVDNILGGGGGGDNVPGTGPIVPGPKDPGTQPPKTPKPPKVETEKDDLLSILVTNVGQAGDPIQVSDIRTFTPLVDLEDPFLVYVGKTAGGGATFLVSADVTVSGDGVCSPSQTDCRTLALGVGETAEFAQIKDPNVKTAVTVLDVETKRVPVETSVESTNATEDTTDTETDLTTEAAAEQLVRSAAARRAGAKAVKSVLSDRLVVKALKDDGVKFRH